MCIVLYAIIFSISALATSAKVNALIYGDNLQCQRTEFACSKSMFYFHETPQILKKTRCCPALYIKHEHTYTFLSDSLDTQGKQVFTSLEFRERNKRRHFLVMQNIYFFYLCITVYKPLNPYELLGYHVEAEKNFANARELKIHERSR